MIYVWHGVLGLCGALMIALPLNGIYALIGLWGWWEDMWIPVVLFIGGGLSIWGFLEAIQHLSLYYS